MLNPGDSRIVEREPDLPGLRSVLDPELFLATVRRLCPGPEMSSAEAEYVRYKPGTSCLVSYRVTVDGRPVHVYGKCHRADQPHKAENAVAGIEVGGPLGEGPRMDTALALAVFPYPHDPEVRGLRKLYEPERTPVRLRRILPAHRYLHGLLPQPLSYKPERRFVGRYATDDRPGAVVRLYPDRQYAALRGRTGAFASTEGLAVPRVIGETARYCSIACEWLPGAPLADTLADTVRTVSLLRRLGEALVPLHRQRPRLRAMTACPDLVQSMRGACRAVGASEPALASRAAGLVSRTASSLDEISWKMHAIHGDLSVDQVVIGDDRLGLIDFDRACYGDPRIDLGSFAADLLVRSIRGSLTPDQAEDFTHALCEAYWGAAGIGDPRSMAPFIAAGLLLSSPEPFRRRDPDWSSATSAILNAAEGVLASACVRA